MDVSVTVTVAVDVTVTVTVAVGVAGCDKWTKVTETDTAVMGNSDSIVTATAAIEKSDCYYEQQQHPQQQQQLRMKSYLLVVL